MKLPSHIKSELTTKQLKELRRCVSIAFPSWARQSQYVSLACSPNAAFRFMQNDAFTDQDKTKPDEVLS
jgi:hypothetical protein